MTGNDIKYIMAMAMITAVILTDMIRFNQKLDVFHLLLYGAFGIYSLIRKEKTK